MHPAAVLALLHDLGGSVDRVLVVGCAPADVAERMGLSEPVAAAVDAAVRLIGEVVAAEVGMPRYGTEDEGIGATTEGLPMTVETTGSTNGRPQGVDEVHILWISEGMSCDGDTVSITAATQPSIEDVVLGLIPGLPKVHLHNKVLAYETGEDFLAPFRKAAARRARRRSCW